MAAHNKPIKASKGKRARWNRGSVSAVSRGGADLGLAVLNSLPVHVAVLDQAGRIITVNEAWLDFARRNNCTHLERLSAGVCYLDVCREAGDAPYAAEALQGLQAVLHGKIQRFTLEYPCHSPAVHRWFLMTVIRPAPEVGGAVVMHTDISEQARTQEALRASEDRFRSVLESMSEGLMLFDAEQNLIYQNPASLRIHGFSRTEGKLGHEQLPVTWKAWDETGRPIIFEQWPVSRVFRLERFQEQVLRVVRVETGQEFYGSYNGCPILDKSGKLVLGFITIRDITEQTRARIALQRSERRVGAFFDSEMMGAIYWNMDGQITDANDRFLKMVGYSRDELVTGQVSWEQMTPPEYRAADEYALNELRATGIDTPYEKEYIRKDGSRLPILIGASMLDEERHEGVAFVLDIAERKRAEEVLARGREELERLVAERTARLQELVGDLEHFSYTITHDMRAPLRAMKGYAELASDVYAEGGSHPEGREFLRRIMTAAERMDALIRDALNYSRAVRQELPLEEVDVGALLRGMLDSYPEFQPSKAHINIEGELPRVMGNEAGLTQCFSNLLGNAVKFVKPGAIPAIRIWAQEHEGWQRIWVEDQGIGIQPQMLPRVFDMFSRAQNSYEGTGIGLALVRKVAQRMGGRVGVESEPGKGSCFWLELKPATAA